jgi:pSer/pThr/pTyr-binding forkhead associated (FHA) protein
MACLRFESELRHGEIIPLDRDKIIFGRHKPCDYVLPYPTISRQHFFVEHNGGKFFVVDQKSNNGTFVNGERVTWVELKDGDLIKVGPFALKVEIPEGRDTSALKRETFLDRLATIVSEEEPLRDSPTVRQMYSREYLAGLEHFNAGRFFEAHEAWEEVWTRSEGETKLFYQMLIQAAVAIHHLERENYRGARGVYNNVMEKLPALPPVFLSLDLEDFSRQFTAFFRDLIEGGKESPVPADARRPTLQLLDTNSNG